MPPPSLSDLCDRFRATLLGAAIGDALGFAVDGAPPGAIARRDDILDDFAARPRGRFTKGQFGEAGACVLAVAESLAEAGGVSGARLAAKLARSWREGAIVGAGRATRESAERLLAGTPWMAAGAPIGRAGNGPAIRSASLGLWDSFEPRRLPRDAQVLAVITHKDPRAAAGAAAVATAVARGANGEPLSPGTIHAAAAAARVLDPRTGDELARVAELCGWEEEPAILSIARLGLLPNERPRGPGISAFVVPSVAFALFAAVRGADDFRKVVGAVLRAGGDVAGIAAMAASIFGAHRGCDAVPARLRRGVRDAERIVDVADRLLEVRIGASRSRGARAGLAH